MTHQIIQNLILIVCALLSGGIGLRIYDKITKGKQKQRSEDFFNDTKEIIDITNDMVLDPVIDRILIFRGGNGGSIPKLGKDYHIKAVFEAHKTYPQTSSLKTYAGITPDSHYISMLLNLMENNKESFVIDQMQDSLLKRIYDYEGIKYSEVYSLCQTEEYIFFISFSSKTHTQFTSDILIQLKIDTSLTKLKSLFLKHYAKNFFNI